MDSKAVKHLQRALTLTKACIHAGNTSRRKHISFGARTRLSDKSSWVIENDKETLEDMKEELRSILAISEELKNEQHKDAKTMRDMYGDPDPVPVLQTYLRTGVMVFNRHRNLLSGRFDKPPPIAEKATRGAVAIAIAGYRMDLLDEYIKSINKH